MDVEVAAKAFAKHQEWEAFIKPRGFISETEIPNELNAKKSYLQGRDKQGRPISVILARNHFNNKDVDEFRRMSSRMHVIHQNNYGPREGEKKNLLTVC